MLSFFMLLMQLKVLETFWNVKKVNSFEAGVLRDLKREVARLDE